jgi:hypothetical protein
MSFSGLKLLHESNNFVGRMIHGVKALSIHLASPAFWGPIENDINEFVIPKGLAISKWREIQNLLVGVDAVEVLVVLAY